MGGMNMTAAIFCIHDTLSRPLLQNRIVSRNNPGGIEIREHCSLKTHF